MNPTPQDDLDKQLYEITGSDIPAFMFDEIIKLILSSNKRAIKQAVTKRYLEGE